jgi:hypothetical protein
VTWTGAISTIEAHLATATSGYQFTVHAGEPGLPAKKTACWFYGGSTDNPEIAETLTDHPFGELVTVRFFWPVGTRAGTPNRTLELEARAVTRALIGAFEGDRKLGGNVEALTIGDAEAGWLNTDNQAWRLVTIPLTLGFTDVESIGE